MRLMKDGSLRIRESNPNGWKKSDVVMRHLVWRKETGEARASADSGRAEVPEKYFGTWVLDVEASNKVIADHPTIPARNKESWPKFVSDLIRWEWVISRRHDPRLHYH